MKKIIISGVLLLSAVTLTACSVSGSEIANNTITDPISQSDNSTLEADVRTTALEALSYAASHSGMESFPTTGANAFIPTESEPSNVVTVVGGYTNWKVVGLNSNTGYTYSYDSATGQYQ